MAAASSSAPTLPPLRSWRTAFLTLRDETTTKPPRISVPELLHSTVFSNSGSLIAAVPDLPRHEVVSDVLFLIELVADFDHVGGDAISIYSQTIHLINEVGRRVPLDLNASYLKRILDSFQKVIGASMGKDSSNGETSANPSRIRCVMDCFETLRRLIAAHIKTSSLLENIDLLKFLCFNIGHFHEALYSYSRLTGSQRHLSAAEKRIPTSSSLWEVQTLCLTMLGEAISRVGSSIPVDIWKSAIEVLGKEMDVLTSKNLVEDNTMAKFYASLLHCLHLVLVDRKSSLSDHVPRFVAAVRLFLNYGLASCRPQMADKSFAIKEKEVKTLVLKSSSNEPEKGDSKPYRPPHLRRNDARDLSDHGSDSDYSDSDGSTRDNDSTRRSKVRVSALLCLQDLCQADSKAFTTQWTILLPTNDVLESRKFDATIMTCLLFDPYLKVRLASASTLAIMLDGPSSVSLQVAEYKDPSKYGAFTPLSCSLGQILMQLHKGVMHLIMGETHTGLLASLLKIFGLLIASTPYARMPEDLLPTVITCLQTQVEEGFRSSHDRISLQAAAVNCLTGALSVSPSLQVQEMLTREILDFNKNDMRRSVLTTLIRLCEQPANLTISFEALQALRALLHSYPKIVGSCWEYVCTIVQNHVEVTYPEVPTSPRRGFSGNTVGVNGEKVTAAAIKVLDDSLRALSGFKGTEDLLDDKLFDIPFTSDCIRETKISSAPHYGGEVPLNRKDDLRSSNNSGVDQWDQAIELFFRLTLRHSSPLVRSASVTCFAGITSAVFFSLKKLYQDFILSSTISAAIEDAVPSVRSAACRAIGVITCFPEICQSAEIPCKFIEAVEINTRDSIVSVRITASWALANICESLHHWFNKVHPGYFTEGNARVVSLVECALRLTNEGDKIKSNAVRALGGLSRYVTWGDLNSTRGNPVEYPSSYSGNFILGSASKSSSWVNKRLQETGSTIPQRASYWLERIVQAFLSCVTTGNVKVQWNVCHALSNLFRNEALSLKDEDWAPSVFSILLLLLRDSSNFKIRIQAAAALAVPQSVLDYGRSFTDVVKGVEHVLENLDSYQISTPSGFKYRSALEKQVTITMLHLLHLASSSENQPLKDFLLKKASFLEEWLKGLFSSVGIIGSTESEIANTGIQKKEIISKALHSLIKVFESRNHSTAEKFAVLYQSVQHNDSRDHGDS